MGVRPPQQNSEEPDTIEFGIPALAAHLKNSDIEFPQTREELIRQTGDPDIPIDAHGHSVSLSSALEEASKREFDDEQEVMNALHPVFESQRASVSTGLLASIRAMLPF